MAFINITMNVKFHGDAALAAMRKRVETGLAAMASVFVTHLKAVVSRPNTGTRMVRRRSSRRGKKGSSYTVYPNPSRPGEPPKLRTGHGRSAITWRKVRWNEVIVGVRMNAKYMLFHEFGYRPKFRGGRRGRFQKRPWFHKTFKADQARLRAIFASYAGQRRAA